MLVVEEVVLVVRVDLDLILQDLDLHGLLIQIVQCGIFMVDLEDPV